MMLQGMGDFGGQFERGWERCVGNNASRGVRNCNGVDGRTQTGNDENRSYDFSGA